MQEDMARQPTLVVSAADLLISTIHMGMMDERDCEQAVAWLSEIVNLSELKGRIKQGIRKQLDNPLINVEGCLKLLVSFKQVKTAGE